MSDVQIKIGAIEEVSAKVRDASKSLEQLQTASKNVNTTSNQQKGMLSSLKAEWVAFAAAAAGAVIAIKEIIRVGSEMLNEFAESERALVTLTAVLKSNENATNATAFALKAYADEMQKVTMFTDDQITAGFTMLAGMGLTEEQMIEVMDAAIALASSGVVPLEAAVQSLGGSFEGSIGALAKAMPQMRAFSDEQLKSGEAIRFVQETYGEVTEAVMNTVAGRQAVIKNLLDEQKAKIGEVIAQQYIAVTANREMIDKMGTWAAKGVDVLTKVGLSLAKIFTWQYELFVGTMKLLSQLVGAVAKTLWAPIEWAFHDVIQSIKGVFVVALNWLITQAEALVQKIGSGISKITGGLLGGGMAGASFGRIDFQRTDRQPLGDTLKGIWRQAGEDSRAFFDNFTSDVKELIEIWKRPAIAIEDTMKAVQAAGGGTVGGGGTAGDYSGAYARQVAKELKMLAEEERLAAMAGSKIPAGVDPNQVAADSLAFAGAGQYMGGKAYEASPIEKYLEGALGGLVEGFMKLESVMKIMDPMKTIFDSFLTTIAPLVDGALAPLVNILTFLGKVLAQIVMPVFKLIAPVVEWITKAFVWLYNNAIMPLGNFIMGLVAAISNLATLIFYVVTFQWGKIKNINWAGNSGNQLTPISLEDLGAGSGTNGSGTNVGSQTTVQQVPDINVYLTIEGSVIGAGGPVQVGREMVGAIEAYLGTGARVRFLEAGA